MVALLNIQAKAPVPSLVALLNAQAWASRLTWRLSLISSLNELVARIVALLNIQAFV